MEESITLSDEVIISKIYVIRGQKVMIDRDLAELYSVETKALKQSVRRNMERFPEDFMFEMSNEELEQWRSDNITLAEDKKGLRHVPFCFTEQGVTMLSCILNSAEAIEVNIRVIRIFARLREMVLIHKDILLKLEQLEKNDMQQDDAIKLIFDYLKELINPKPGATRKIGFKRRDEKDD